MQSPERFPTKPGWLNRAARRSYLISEVERWEAKHLTLRPQPRKRSSEEQQLLDQVLVSPDEDQPRLTYADWFAAHGQKDRADFIRWKIANPDDRSAEHQFAAKLPQWLEDDLDGFAIRDPKFVRGFIEEVSITGRTFISNGDALFRSAPIRSVHLIASEIVLDELPDQQIGKYLVELDLSDNGIRNGGLKKWLEHGKLTQLKGWNLAGNQLDSKGVSEFFTHSLAGQLTSLDLSRNHLRGLSNVGNASNLKSLKLESTHLDSDQIVRWIENAPYLENLDISMNPALSDNHQWVALLASRSLKSLDLSGCQGITDFKVIPASVQSLRWYLGKLGDEGAEHLFCQQHHFIDLDLSVNRLHDEAIASSLTKRELGSLRSFNLSGNDLGPKTAKILLDRAVFPVLECLHLGAFDLSGFRSCSDAPPLTRLTLADTSIDDHGLASLLDSSLVETLEYLDLSRTRIGPRAVHRLEQSPSLGKLCTIVLESCPRLSMNELESLRERFRMA
jgi:uncharacterized protein (TIGR02996 family)